MDDSYVGDDVIPGWQHLLITDNMNPDQIPGVNHASN